MKVDFANLVMALGKRPGSSSNLFKLNGSNKCQCGKTNGTHHLPPSSLASPPPGASPQSESGALNHQIDEQVLVKRKMPKRKRKFGKGATRGGDQKSCWSDRVDQHAVPVPKNPATADGHVNTDSVIVKLMNKKQLQQRLNCNNNKLMNAEKKVTATQQKLIAAKAHCKLLASLALEQCKDGCLVHQQAEREMSVICKELDNAQTRIGNIIVEAHHRII
jgi:hypothetical protein